MTKNLVVFRTKLLPYSETFIKEQVLSYKKWSATLVGQFLLTNGLCLNNIKFSTFEKKYSKTANLKRNIFKLFSFSPESDFNAIKELKPDLIHIHFGVDAVINWPLFKKMSVPIVITLHGYDITIKKEWWRSGNEGIHLKHYPEQLIKISHYSNVNFIAVSEALKKKAVEFGIPEEKITVSYIGIDTAGFKKTNTNVEERKQILFVGRLVEKKGAKILLEAFSQITKKHPDYALKFIGDGPLKLQLEQYANQIGVDACFMGSCSKQQVIDELSKTAVFCLPSIHARNGDAEGFGLVLLEASACGIPVVTSALGGATEGIIHGKTGYSFPEGNSDQLAIYITKILSDLNLMESMGESGRDFVQNNYDLKQCALTLERLYDKIITEHNLL